MNTRLKVWIPALLVVFAVMINMAGFVTGQDWGDDFAGYVIQAQTLRSGDFKGLEHSMGTNPFVLNYPWGFPILLTPVIHLFENNYTALKEYVFVFFLLGLFFFYSLFRREKEPALIALLLVASCPYFWYFKNNLGSDFPNLCFVMCSLYLMQRLVVQQKKLVHPYMDSCLLGLAIFAAFSMRTQSLVLLVTLAVMQLVCFRKSLLQPKNLSVALIPYLVFFISKFLLEILIPVKAVSYLGAYSGFSLTETVWKNLFYYINIWKELFSQTLILNYMDATVAGICLFLFVIGIAKHWKNNLLFIVFICGTVGMLLLTPFYQGIRYLMPVIPLFFYFFVKGVYYMAAALRPHAFSGVRDVSLGVFVALPLASIFMLSFNKAKVPVVEGPYTPNTASLFAFLKQNTSSESLIGYWKPRAMLLYSGRNSVIPLSYQACLEKNAGYYIYYRYAYTDQMPLDSLTPYPGRYNKIYENDDFKVFKVLRDTLVLGSYENDTVSGAGEFAAKIDSRFFEPSASFGPERLIALWSNEPVTSKKIELPKGNYLLCIYAKGTPAAGQEPLNRILLNDSTLGLFKSYAEVTRTDFLFSVSRKGFQQLKLKLENDYSGNGEDRNTMIYSILIYKASTQARPDL